MIDSHTALRDLLHDILSVQRGCEEAQKAAMGLVFKGWVGRD